LDRRLRDHRPTPIARARAGEIVKIVGVVRAGAPVLTSPLTGAKCVWYVSRVKPYGPWYAQDGAAVVETRSRDIYVDDDSGSAVVRMGRAVVSLTSMRDAWQREPSTAPESWDWDLVQPPETEEDRSVAKTEVVRRFLQAHGMSLHYPPPTALESLMLQIPVPPGKRTARFREDVLREGTRVAVVGRAWQEADPSAPAINLRQPAVRLVLGEDPDGVIVSDETGACS
jgi:hypothetical protein